MIDVQKIYKNFPDKQALSGFTLHVGAGEIFGLVGPNGAGKTTLMKALSTLLPIDRGTAQIGGLDVTTHGREVRRLIGYLPDQPGVYQDMSVCEFLEFFADAFQLTGSRHRAAVERAFSAGSITIEKEQRTLAGLFTSLLTSPQIWWGKFVSSLLFVLLLLVTSLPVLSMAFAFGGIGPWEVFSATLTTVIVLACMSAVGLYCSSLFQRSVHATAVSYAAVIAISVVTAVVFFVRIQIYESAHPSDSVRGWYDIPLNIRAPMYVNPFFFLTASFAPVKQLYPAWVTCAGVFTLMGAVAIALTLRNLRRRSDL